MARTTPRLIDIAEKAELSVTSISRILSGQRLSEYSPDTQARVKKIANELGWRPNLVVQGMKTGKTHTYGVFVAPYDTFWTGVLYGVHDKLLEAKQVPLVLWPHAVVHPTVDPMTGAEWADDDGPVEASEVYPAATLYPASEADAAGSDRRELDRINCLEDRRVDAIISWPLHEDDARQRLTMLSGRGLPVVTIDDQLPDPAESIYVGNDEDKTMAKVHDHLAALGHRNVLYCGLPTPHTWAARRRAAFERAWSDRSACGATELEDDGSRHDRIVEWIKRYPEATAVVAANDHLARHVIRAVADLGLRVPEDLSVVGYGNDVFGRGDVPLTTIDQQPYRVGEAAARVSLRAQEADERSVLVPTRLLIRESTATARVEG